MRRVIAGRRLRQPLCRELAVIAAMLLPGVAFLAACSTVPSREWPPLVEGEVAVDYRVPTDQLVEVPVSSPEFVLLSLQVDPAPVGERWRSGRRFLQAPDGCEHLTVRCRYRAYDAPSGPIDVARLFPGSVLQVGK